MVSMFEALNPKFEYRNKSKTRNSKAQNDFGHWHFEFWICLRFRAWDFGFPFRTNGISYLFAAKSAKRRSRLVMQHRQSFVDKLPTLVHSETSGGKPEKIDCQLLLPSATLFQAKS
jgi:hypothetical protein